MSHCSLLSWKTAEGSNTSAATANSMQHSSGNKKAEEDADKEIEEKLKEIEEIKNKAGQQVVDDLLNAVTDVRPEVPDRVEQPVS